MDDAANTKAFRDGWFLTGDLGHMDAEGYLFITGRSSDMYISGGSNVYPREIEELMLTHPALSEVAILGVPHKQWGEVGLAVCVCETGKSVTGDEITALLNRFQRTGVPLYVFYPAGSNQARVLDQIVTPGTVLSTLNEKIND